MSDDGEERPSAVHPVVAPGSNERNEGAYRAIIDAVAALTVNLEFLVTATDAGARIGAEQDAQRSLKQIVDLVQRLRAQDAGLPTWRKGSRG